MVPQNLVLVDTVPGAKTKALTAFIKRARQSRIREAFAKVLQTKPNDPYLYILLADQELVGGREQQARYLVEAAYEAFDGNTSPNVFRLHVAG